MYAIGTGHYYCCTRHYDFITVVTRGEHVNGRNDYTYILLL